VDDVDQDLLGAYEALRVEIDMTLHMTQHRYICAQVASKSNISLKKNSFQSSRL
jgi:hypothetical protein